jgi:hypothetical protein
MYFFTNDAGFFPTPAFKPRNIIYLTVMLWKREGIVKVVSRAWHRKTRAVEHGAGRRSLDRAKGRGRSRGLWNVVSTDCSALVHSGSSSEVGRVSRVLPQVVHGVLDVVGAGVKTVAVVRVESEMRKIKWIARLRGIRKHRTFQISEGKITKMLLKSYTTNDVTALFAAKSHLGSMSP